MSKSATYQQLAWDVEKTLPWNGLCQTDSHICLPVTNMFNGFHHNFQHILSVS